MTEADEAAPAALTDFLGRTYGVGDTVVYAATSGRSVTMVFGRVVALRPSGAIDVQPLDAARWEQHSGRTHYVDTRTGKRIDPHVEDGRHYAKPPCYRHDVTGEEVSYEAWPDRRPAAGLHGDWLHWRYQPAVMREYVEQVHEGPRPVTLQITENVVRIDRPGDGS